MEDGHLQVRVEPQGVFYKKRPGHIYFMEDDLLHTIYKLQYV